MGVSAKISENRIYDRNETGPQNNLMTQKMNIQNKIG